MKFIPKTEKALTCGYEYTPLFYSTPCRVQYYDASIKEFDYGVAVYNYLIKGYNGELVLLDVIAQEAENNGVFWDDAIVELDWQSFNYNR